jgi:hypothetical protein
MQGAMSSRRTSMSSKRAGLLAAGVVALCAIGSPRGEAAVDVSSFAVTPATTAAGGHPNLTIAVKFAEPATGVKDIALHLPGGLTANPSAFAYCSRGRLVRYICPPKSRLGFFTVVAVSYGIELPFSATLYNMRPRPTERIRIGVPIPTPQRVFAAELSIKERPADKGLDFVATDLPRDVAGVTVRVSELKIWLIGTVRRRIRKRLRWRAFLTNPTACVPAASSLELTLYEPPGAVITRSSSFTPTGCR